MALPKERKATVMIPVKVVLYEDLNGITRCARVETPTPQYVGEIINKGKAHSDVGPLLKDKDDEIRYLRMALQATAGGGKGYDIIDFVKEAVKRK